MINVIKYNGLDSTLKLQYTHKMAKPLVIFDGDCGFCKLCVDRWQAVGGSRLEFKPYQEVSAQFPQIKIQEFQNAVHLVEDSKITKGAEAVFRIKKIAGGSG